MDGDKGGGRGATHGQLLKDNRSVQPGKPHVADFRRAVGADFKISFTVPNKLMQDQFKKGRPKLMNFLREKLNNYGIAIVVLLNEAVEKKFAYTPDEKYKKLKEKNPFLEKLRQAFELDL